MDRRKNLITKIKQKLIYELDSWEAEIIDDIRNRFYSIKDALYDDINEAILEIEQNESKRID